MSACHAYRARPNDRRRLLCRHHGWGFPRDDDVGFEPGKLGRDFGQALAAPVSSYSSLDYRRSDACIVENGFAARSGVSKSAKVVLAKPENSRNAARGMFLTAAELCRYGFNVTPTSRNMAGADLLITDDRCRNTWTIQVKVTDQSFKRRRG